MIVRLPNEKQIVVDSKAPLLAYLEALEAETEEEKADKLRLHSRHIQTHMNKLSQKTYWDQFNPTPEFVVLFIPGENFFSAALEHNPGLIEEGVNKGVILATPTTPDFASQGRSFWVAAGNHGRKRSSHQQAGQRALRANRHHGGSPSETGRNMEKCVSTYNQVIGSFERRVLASARKFSELGITKRDGAEIPYVSPVEKTTRPVSLPDGTDDQPSRR